MRGTKARPGRPPSDSPKTGPCCSSSTCCVNLTPSASSQPVRPPLWKGIAMSTNKRVRKRLRKDRPMSTISLRIPDDVIDDLKLLAPVLGFSGYQPLLRAYVGQGLR